MIKKLKKQGGFTVLESIVAIMILSLSISGAFSAVSQSLSQATIAKDEIKAFYLAQEAIEIIRNKRDNNQLYKIENPSTSNTWLYGIAQNVADPCYFGKTCRTDAKSFSFVDCGETCPVLKQETETDPDPYLYNYSIGNPTNFTRGIQIESISPDEIAVTVRISWNKGVMPMEFKIKTLLFN